MGEMETKVFLLFLDLIDFHQYGNMSIVISS